MRERGVNIPALSQSNKLTLPSTTIGVSDVVKEVPAATGKVLRWVGKQIVKPISVIATVSEKIGQAIGEKSLQPITEIPKSAAEIITGKKERSFINIWRENLPEHPLAATMIGLVTDIVADPLNFVGGITTKGLALAEKGFKKIPLFKGLKTTFSTATDDKTFNIFIDEMKSLGEYRKAQILEKAREIQKDVSKLPKEDIIKISDYIEKGIKSTPEISALGEKLKSIYKEWKTIEKEKGIKGGEIVQYVPHIKVEEPLTQTIKKSIFPAREWTTKLGGAEKSRQILKFTTEEGKEFIGKAENLGFRKLNTENLISQLEKSTGNKIKTLQKIQKLLARPEIEKGTADLRSLIYELKQQLKTDKNFITETLKEPTLKEFETTIKSILQPERQEMIDTILKLEQKIMTSAGKEFLYKPISTIASRKARIVEIEKEIVKLQNEMADKIQKLQYFNYVTPKGEFVKATQASISEIAEAFGKHFFEENPAIQMAYRGLAHVKAITSKEFFDGVKKFASKTGVETAVPELKGLRFAEDIAKQIDNYYESIKPEELKVLFRTYDAVLNWWKAQVLIAPSYHIRNVVGNLWNNFLAGVKNPISYIQAGLLQMGKGRDFKIAGMTGDEFLKLAERRGVLGKGWYAADIPTAIESGLKATWKKGINPLSQQNYAFRLSKAIGTALENNARLAHFIDKLKSGSSIDDAVLSVKKYLFDYNDLTKFEKTVLKRVFPFYTWTKNNIPLQLEHLITQPGKYAGLEKVIRAIEKISMGDNRPANEKYLSDYIKNNTSMRVGYNKETNTYQYFLLGNWLPSYQAMDFLSQPLYNMMAMLTPILKTPMELLANKSSFFRNTLGEADLIENYPGETVNFLGFNMPKKTAVILRNIRLLNELDKLNPGKIFGGEKGEPSIFKGLPAVKTPFGVISPAQYKYSPTGIKPTATERFAGFLFGKLQQYKESTAREIYQQDTEKRKEELERAIRNAAKKGDKERVKVLQQQLRDFLRERGR
jgi:hypothetical protein